MASLSRVRLTPFLRLLSLLVAVVACSHSAWGQSTNAIFNGPQNMDAGLQAGMNNIAGYVFAVLKLLSLIALGVAFYQVTHNGLGKAILAVIAAILLWFAPVISNIARNIGAGAAQQSQLGP